jgi:hypothetical protein
LLRADNNVSFGAVAVWQPFGRLIPRGALVNWYTLPHNQFSGSQAPAFSGIAIARPVVIIVTATGAFTFVHVILAF